MKKKAQTVSRRSWGGTDSSSPEILTFGDQPRSGQPSTFKALVAALEIESSTSSRDLATFAGVSSHQTVLNRLIESGLFGQLNILSLWCQLLVTIWSEDWTHDQVDDWQKHNQLYPNILRDSIAIDIRFGHICIIII